METGVIRARVHLEAFPTPEPPRTKSSPVDALEAMLLLGMVAVTALHLLQALLRRQVTYLPLLGVCVLVFLVVGAVSLVVLLLILVVRDVAPRLAGRRRKTATRLAEESEAGEHGAPVTARGTAGWLTPDGIVLATGRRFSWARVLAPELDERDEHVRVRAELRPLGQARFTHLAVGYGMIVSLAFGAIVSAALAFGFLGQQGFRYDLAAVVSLSVVLLLISGFGLRFPRHVASPVNSRVEIAVLRSRISRDELQRLLDDYLRSR